MSAENAPSGDMNSVETEPAAPTSATKTGTKKPKEQGKPAGMAALEQRLREEVGNFEFGALLSGVSTISQPGIAHQKSTDTQLPSPSIPTGGVDGSSPTPGIPGIYSRPPLPAVGASLKPARPTPLAEPPIGGMAGGPLDSARAFNDYTRTKSGSSGSTAKPLSGWTYRTKRSIDFGSIIAIIVIAAAVCVGAALIFNMVAKPPHAPTSNAAISAPSAAQSTAQQPVHKKKHKRTKNSGQ